MEFLEKWFTKRNATLVSIAIGICTIVILLLSSTADFSTSDPSSMIGIFCFLYYIYFLAAILMCAMYAFLYFKKANKDRLTLIGMVIAIVAVIVCMMNWKIIGALRALLNEDFLGMMGIMSVADSIELRLNLFRLALIANAVFGGYQLYLLKTNKGIELDPNTKQEINENLDQAKDSVMKGASIAGEQLNKGTQKVVTFLKTKNGKLTGIAVIVCIVVIGAVFAYNANKKTNIDLAATCEYTVQGESGRGTLNRVSCTNDYDGDDTKINKFLRYVTYDVENDGTLENGDKIKIYANYADQTVEELKLNITNDSYEVEISGLIEYYTKTEDIPKELLDSASTITKEKAMEYLKEPNFYYGDTLYKANDVKAEEPELIAAFLETDSSYSHDAVFLYKAKATGTVKEKSESTTLYCKVTISSFSSVIAEETSKPTVSADLIHAVFDTEFKTDDEAIEYVKEKSYYSNLEQIDLSQQSTNTADA